MPNADPGRRTLGRYEVVAELGRGGMAIVYRVFDPVSGEFLACKQLMAASDPRVFAESCVRFEREFHTLSELSHPRIIEVSDYAVDVAGPFYTMELLDGGDLVTLSPLPWQRACVLFHDVCSSLALLHSRRLVHCDITPRNVRCTKDGRAKLFDFGVMVPMGRGTLIVGTPSFAAPEVVARTDLDARTDLFSLGATLYYALTGRVAFAARDFSELIDAWSVKPRPPSHFVPGIPAALDRLTMSLLSVAADERPRNAFEVMQRLAVIAGIEQLEALDVSRAYLSAPVLVGRQPLMAAIRHEFEAGLAGHGRTLIVRGSAGLGRSRVLNACVIEAKLRGLCVARASADAARGQDFAIARALAEQLLESIPDAAIEAAAAANVLTLLFAPNADRSPSATRLLDLTQPSFDRASLQDALARWLLALSERQTIAIVVDDVQRIDEPSAALLAQCAADSENRHLVVLLSVESAAGAPSSTALEVLTRQARIFELAPLIEAETTSLLTSVFGDVPHVGVVGHAVHALAAGNPRLCMELARHLVESGIVRYADGSWTLPAQLNPSDLPQSADSALRARVAALSVIARQLLEGQALASHEAFTREDYAQLSPGVAAQRVDLALLELVAREFLISDGRVYWLAHRSWSHALVAHMSEGEVRERHAAIALLYGDNLKSVSHWFAADMLERGLDLLLAQFEVHGEALDIFATLHIPAWELARLVARALGAAITLERPARDIFELRRRLAGFAVASDDGYYWQSAPELRERLRHDSGLAKWEQLEPVGDSGARITQALQYAFERFASTPEAERVYRPDEAIRHLVQFVAISIAIAFRSYDTALVASLPALLEPFAPLSPAVAAIHQNALASRQARCWAQPERARARWLEVYDTLAKFSEAELPHVEVIRHAIASGLGVMEAQLGLASAEAWAERVTADPMQAVQAMYIRKVVSLQQGDWAAADSFRKRAEQLSLQSRVRPMFTSTLAIELAVHARAGDLTGVKQVKDRIARLAATSPHWRAGELLAEAQFDRLCGRLDNARAAFEACLRLTEPDASDPTRVVPLWPYALSGYIETLVELGEFEHAKRFGLRSLEQCRTHAIEASAWEVARALSLAEAKLGEFDRAEARIRDVIAAQRELGVTGLLLGASYQARARIAIWARDEDALSEYAALTAREYRRSPGSPLGACHERLMDEARVAFPHRLAAFTEVESLSGIRSGIEHQTSPARLASQIFRQATTAFERASFALSLLCEDRRASAGHLFLVADQGLVLAASQGDNDSSPELYELARAFLREQLDETEQATQFESELQQTQVRGREPATTATGSAQPVALACFWQGSHQYVGVALLVINAPGIRVNAAARLAAVIATTLLEAGDARACTEADLRSERA